MAISSDFAQAVRDDNKLRVRIMLKDSLLLDKSFSTFEKMQEYAMNQGVNPWIDTDIPLEKSEEPWTKDTLNYELTALVNDFTKEHVSYIKEIISALYKDDATTESYQHKIILEEIRNLNQNLDKIVDPTTNKRRWSTGDINDIKQHAKNIVEACSKLQNKVLKKAINKQSTYRKSNYLSSNKKHF